MKKKNDAKIVLERDENGKRKRERGHLGHRMTQPLCAQYSVSKWINIDFGFSQLGRVSERACVCVSKSCPERLHKLSISCIKTNNFSWKNERKKNLHNRNPFFSLSFQTKRNSFFCARQWKEEKNLWILHGAAQKFIYKTYILCTIMYG